MGLNYTETQLSLRQQSDSF